MQLLLVPDPRPLVERFGVEFFRNSPECAGVYIMRDGAGSVLYVGKARNLRKRLASYRVANPDRMRRRHLRLLRSVTCIDFETCPDEAAALARESELLLALQPRFNRAGTWPAPKRFLLWNHQLSGLALKAGVAQEEGWFACGPTGSGTAGILRNSLSILLWFVLQPGTSILQAPQGWFTTKKETSPVTIPAAPGAAQIAAERLDALFNGNTEAFTTWVRDNLHSGLSPFEIKLIETHLELISESLLARKWERHPLPAGSETPAAGPR